MTSGARFCPRCGTAIGGEPAFGFSEAARWSPGAPAQARERAGRRRLVRVLSVVLLMLGAVAVAFSTAALLGHTYLHERGRLIADCGSIAAPKKHGDLVDEHNETCGTHHHKVLLGAVVIGGAGAVFLGTAATLHIRRRGA